MNEIKIKSYPMPLSHWEQVLSKTQYENLLEILKSDYPTGWQDFEYSANEVFYALVLYEGGVYAHDALSLIKTIYDVELN